MEEKIKEIIERARLESTTDSDKFVKELLDLFNINDSLDLCELERKLDETLEKETRETLTKWIKQQRQ